MLYISGIHALNLSCELETCGDWHQSAIQWNNIPLQESEGSIFGDYGIELNRKVPEQIEIFAVANHIRALLDLLVAGKFSIAQGMKNDYICRDKYTEEIFEKVLLLKNNENWNEIDNFMKKEYLSQWSNYKRPFTITTENADLKTENREVIKELLLNLNDNSSKKIDSLCIMKANAFSRSEKISDLYDLTFIYNNYWEHLSVDVKSIVREVISYKSFECFIYLISGIDNLKLAEAFLLMYNRLGLVADEKDLSELK